MNLEVPHQLDQKEARERIDQFLPNVKEKYADSVKKIEQEWKGDDLEFSFEVMGMKISGLLKVIAEKVIVDGKIPFAAVAFKGKIKNDIKTGLENLLA